MWALGTFLLNTHYLPSLSTEEPRADGSRMAICSSYAYPQRLLNAPGARCPDCVAIRRQEETPTEQFHVAALQQLNELLAATA
ncbi:hypothetical protein D5S17_09485 [Pseudonocardiaceae bacterium YIM PH 21723]|nr:hypothetical protein D5S17_09485 [Pseudonocardiaceae bacterium YIM PH 21723]